MAYFGDNAVFAWADIAAAGSPHLDNDYNCSGVTDHGTGDHQVNFSTNASNAHYAIIGSNIGETNDDHTYTFVCSAQSAPTTSNCRFNVVHRSGSLRDQNRVNIVIVAEYG